MKFENFYCLSIRQDRYSVLCKNFEKFGLPIPKMFEGFRCDEKAEKCCLFGHMSLIMMARALDFPHIFIFEDDAYPRKDVVERMSHYIDNRPANCGVLVLGRNGEAGPISRHGDYHIVVHRPFGAHAYLVYKSAYDEILSSMEKAKIADIALKGENFTNVKPYWTNEYLFIQKNMDNNCMSKGLVNKYGMYFYPAPNGGLGVHRHLPMDGKWE